VLSQEYFHPYEGHAGIYTHGLNGAFFLEIIDRYPDGTVVVRNLHDVGKIKCPRVQAPLEGDLIYPLLRGRSMGRWRAKAEEFVLIVQDPTTQTGYPTDWLQRTHPLTWAYLKKFEKLLLQRKSFRKFADPEKDPFYTMYSVAGYTFHPHKVAWMDISSTVKATVLPTAEGNDLIVPEHTVMFLTTDSAEEAHYVAAVLNSNPVNTIIAGYIVDNHLSTHPVENVVIPRFDPNVPIHGELVKLSKACHIAAANADDTAVLASEQLINTTVEGLWADMAN